VYLSKKNVQRWTDSEGFKPHKEWLLETDGTNLAEVMTFPAVNHRTTVSNDVLEMFQVLGIEGARSSLFNEVNIRVRVMIIVRDRGRGRDCSSSWIYRQYVQAPIFSPFFLILRYVVSTRTLTLTLTLTVA
jgi:hypothetical protein